MAIQGHKFLARDSTV